MAGPFKMKGFSPFTKNGESNLAHFQKRLDDAIKKGDKELASKLRMDIKSAKKEKELRKWHFDNRKKSY